MRGIWGFSCSSSAPGAANEGIGARWGWLGALRAGVSLAAFIPVPSVSPSHGWEPLLAPLYRVVARGCGACGDAAALARSSNGRALNLWSSRALHSLLNPPFLRLFGLLAVSFPEFSPETFQGNLNSGRRWELDLLICKNWFGWVGTAGMKSVSGFFPFQRTSDLVCWY